MPSAGLDEEADAPPGSTTSTSEPPQFGNSSSVPTPVIGWNEPGPNESQLDLLQAIICQAQARLDSLNSSVLRQTRELKVLRESIRTLQAWAQRAGLGQSGSS